MAAEIISGKLLSKKLKDELASDVAASIDSYGREPHLVVILVGNDPGSVSYVTGKSKACDYVGIKNTTIRYEDTIPEEELLDTIYKLNADESVDGILVQLPLPKHICEKKIIRAIDVSKDVDGFHPDNVSKLVLGEDCLLPCTPSGIIKLLQSTGITIAGKHAVVIGRSNIVGKPVAQLLLRENATVTTCHSRTVDMKEITNKADIVIVATGHPNTLTADMIKPGAVVIDVGVNRINGKLIGDCDYNGLLPIAGFITPVPGGVGPMTITCLMENTVKAWKNICK